MQSLIKKIRNLRNQELTKLKLNFSSEYYLSQFPQAERSNVADPLGHFLIYWNLNGYDPSPLFSMSDYLAANPDVAQSSVNPFVHFIEKGISERRPLAPVTQTLPGWGKEENQIVLSPPVRDVSDFFSHSALGSYLKSIGWTAGHEYELNKVDEGFYRSYFPSEKIADCNAHFDEFGWKSGLNPTSWFNTKFYLDMYEDIKREGINPFVHFVEQGYLEFRLPNHSGFKNFNKVLQGTSIEIEFQSWVNSDKTFILTDALEVQQQILKKKLKNGPFVISLGHSTYMSDIGGVQLYTFCEAQSFNKLGINYLSVSPSIPLPVLADSSKTDLCVRFTLNNEELVGDVLLSDLPDIVRGISPTVQPISLIVNSLYGWHPELLSPIIRKISPGRLFWIFHDYSAFCANSNLNFESSFSCNNPSTRSGICSTCRFGRNRDEHVSRVRFLLNSYEWEFVTPSPSTQKNIMQYLNKNSSEVKIIPHGKLVAGNRLRSFEGKPRIAYVGQSVSSKGWLHFLNFVNLGLKEFDFFHFGTADSNEPGIQFIPLRNDYKNLNLSRDLLVLNQIDAVFICPNWEETFCFVAYEAIAAGCLVICTRETGNVYDASIGTSIVIDLGNELSIAGIEKEILEARRGSRVISDFIFSGTIASEHI